MPNALLGVQNGAKIDSNSGCPGLHLTQENIVKLTNDEGIPESTGNRILPKNYRSRRKKLVENSWKTRGRQYSSKNSANGESILGVQNSAKITPILDSNFPVTNALLVIQNGSDFG